MPKIVGGITQPCLRPLRMEKGSMMAPSKFIVPLTPSWKEAMMLSSCGGSGVDLLQQLEKPSSAHKGRMPW